jgi:hypothetical protein
VRVKRKQQNVYVATISALCGIFALLQTWHPTHFLAELGFTHPQLVRHCKRYYPMGCHLKPPIINGFGAMKQRNKQRLLFRNTSVRY